MKQPDPRILDDLARVAGGDDPAGLERRRQSPHLRHRGVLEDVRVVLHGDGRGPRLDHDRDGLLGERARVDARIILEGVKTEVYNQRTKESNYVVWQKQLNQGSRTETLTLPRFTGTVNTPFRAPGGISVQILAGEFRSQIATLSQPFGN
jgi:hypothetical protein